MEQDVYIILNALLVNATKVTVWMLNYRVLLLNHVLLVWYVRVANASVSVNEPNCDYEEVNNDLFN